MIRNGSPVTPYCLNPPQLCDPLPRLQLYWASPLTYAQQAIFINEFSDPRWDTPTDYFGTTIRLGDAILNSRGLWTDRCGAELEGLEVWMCGFVDQHLG